MATARNTTMDAILNIYRSQLRKYRSLSVYDNEGTFLFGKKTEFGTTVTQSLIDVTEKRLMELLNKRLTARNIPPIENYSNGKANS